MAAAAANLYCLKLVLEGRTWQNRQERASLRDFTFSRAPTNANTKVAFFYSLGPFELETKSAKLMSRATAKSWNDKSSSEGGARALIGEANKPKQSVASNQEISKSFSCRVGAQAGRVLAPVQRSMCWLSGGHTFKSHNNNNLARWPSLKQAPLPRRSRTLNQTWPANDPKTDARKLPSSS